MMGIANIVCAMTIAAGVKSRAREPRGPERERARYSTRPTTTGGNPKNALIKTTTDRRPRKEKTARAVPTGKLTAVATTVAPTLTLIESATISTKFCDSLMVMMPSGAWLMADHVSVFQLVLTARSKSGQAEFERRETTSGGLDLRAHENRINGVLIKHKPN